MPEPTTAELVEQVRAGIAHRGGDQAHAALGTLVERLEVVERERDALSKLVDQSDETYYKDRADAAEARVQELRQALDEQEATVSDSERRLFTRVQKLEQAVQEVIRGCEEWPGWASVLVAKRLRAALEPPEPTA